MFPSAGAIPDPIEDAVRRRFDGSDGVRFSCGLGDDDLRWWRDHLGRRGYYPLQLCRRLGGGLPFRTEFEVTSIDPTVGHVRIEITAFDTEGHRVLKAGRSVEFDEKQVHLNKLEIETSHRGRLHGRTMLRNAYELAVSLGFTKLGLTAIDFGSCVWADAGFYPTKETWQDTGSGRLRDKLNKAVEGLPDAVADWRRKNDIYEVVNGDEPRTIWAIAGLRGMVESRQQPGRQVKLGWALLVESGATWKGELPFTKDKEAERRLLAYLAKLDRAATA